MSLIRLKIIYGAIFLSIFITGCEDPELNAMMEDYCDCIDKHKMNQVQRYECIELMDSIQEVYKGQPRKLNELVEKTDDCY